MARKLSAIAAMAGKIGRTVEPASKAYIKEIQKDITACLAMAAAAHAQKNEERLDRTYRYLLELERLNLGHFSQVPSNEERIMK
jgi:hypothetical protein